MFQPRGVHSQKFVTVSSKKNLPHGCMCTHYDLGSFAPDGNIDFRKRANVVLTRAKHVKLLTFIPFPLI